MFRNVRVEDRNGISITNEKDSALRVLSTTHANIHDGKGFGVSDTVSVPLTSSFDILIKVPAGKEVHLRDFLCTVDLTAATVVLYKTPTTTVDGGAIAIVNKDTSTGAAASGITAFTAPTVTVVGTPVHRDRTTSAKHTMGSVTSTEEYILGAGLNYLLRITNPSGAAVDVDYSLFWYELAV